MSTSDTDTFYSSTPFQDYFRSSPQSFLFKADSPRFTILAVSDKAERLVGIPRGEMLGRGMFEVFPGTADKKSDRDSVFDSFGRVIESKKADELPLFTYQVPTSTGGQMQMQYWRHCNEPLLNENGNVAYLINTSTNVTQQVLQEQQHSALLERQAEMEREQQLNEELAATNEELLDAQERMQELIEKLAASEAKYRSLIELSPVAQQVFRGEQFVMELANETMLQFLGKGPEIIGKPLFIAVPEIVGQPIINHLYDVYRTGRPLELNEERVVLHRNGRNETGYYNVSYRALYEHGRINGILGIAIDVTEQVLSRIEVAELNTRLQIAMDAGGFGSAEVEFATGAMECNEQFKTYFGRTKDEELTYPELFAAMLPQYREHIRRQVAFAKSNHSVYQAQYEVVWPDGSVHWISAHGKARYDEQGNAIKMVGLITEITESKQDEQRKNDFIGMVSHELKTPLTTIGGYVQILQSKSKKANDTFSQGMLGKTVQQVTKMTAMINGFLDVSRLESGKIQIDLQHFDLAELLRETEEETLATVSSHQVVFLPAEQTFVQADRDKISHVLSNLISNALKYSPSGSTITISCLIKGSKVLCGVQDEGTGISQEDLPRLFERYYRVKEVQSTTIAGFGIGLYLSAEIIKVHGGDLWAESELGKGSIFYFSLPSVQFNTNNYLS